VTLRKRPSPTGAFSILGRGLAPSPVIDAIRHLRSAPQDAAGSAASNRAQSHRYRPMTFAIAVGSDFALLALHQAVIFAVFLLKLS
jgi:hypothetical protein